MRNKLLGAATIILLVSATAFAQGGPPDEASGRPCRRNRAEMRERMQQVRMEKLSEALNLEEGTTQQLAVLMDNNAVQQRQLRDRHRALLDQLEDELAKESVDPVVVRKAVDDFKKSRLEMAQANNSLLDEISGILTEEQMAEFLVFVPQFERNMRRMMFDARARRMQRDCFRTPAGPDWECPLGNEPMQRQRGRGFSDSPPAMEPVQ
ncbi:MAG: hypothetical protein C4520_09470 [Candidatus Abyssobacteria bacterium SURF_5]|uniref:Periplasmic heavy metal sensor n=1 Tax=Abyssobacteria bacterium (strain SURF_5) TaxID=2093360 RepID=A0A3A4NMF2_ABYX5|nr:MAG: hypothetical protein C4520_09470 [Candidatus Abyssubacteria bacterium SURF_5]